MGTWAFGASFPDRFAAIVPVSGSFDPETDAVSQLKNMPVWAFHGANDIVVPVQYTDVMVDKIRLLGNSNVRYTRYDFSPAYDKYPDMIGAVVPLHPSRTPSSRSDKRCVSRGRQHSTCMGRG